MRCFGCGVEKNTDVKELYTIDDRLIQDVPIRPLMVLCCQGVEEHRDWRKVVVCHACFARLDPDTWISSRCWASLSPLVPYEKLPPHEPCRQEDPAYYAGWPVPPSQ